jgi:hypothetical protein
MMTFPIYGKIIQMFQTTNKLYVDNLLKKDYNPLDLWEPP